MKKLLIGLVVAIFLVQSCGFYGRQRGLTDWYHIPKPDYSIPPQAQYLKGLKFCLDPGHGGDAHIPNYKRGPTGVREAEMNLRVAFFLKDFLEKSGAIVILTRTGDDNIDLKNRADIAMLNQVDMFISLHHNACDNPRTNYASTWYHGDADFSPVSLDLARYIQQSLEENLRLPNLLPTGLLSDYLMYPDGFGVLRHLEVPGILLESSFFSNPKEEKLLDKPAYNRLEAYAIYLGIVRWAAAGIPKVVLVEPHPDTTITNKQPTIYMKINDGLHKRKGSWMLTREQYFSRQVTFFLDDSIAPFILDRDQNLIMHTPDKPMASGWHTAEAEVSNYLGNHNLPRPTRFRIAPPAQYLIANSWNNRLPADGKAFTGIDALALDADSANVADDDTVKATVDRGRLFNPAVATINGLAPFYIQADSRPGTATVKLSAGQVKTNVQVSFSDKGATLVAGFCRNEKDNQPLDNVHVTLLPDSVQQLTNAEGVYYFPQATPGEHELHFRKNGYFSQHLPILVKDGQSNIDTVRLRPVFAGVLHDFILVVDPRFGGKEPGVKISDRLYSTQVNLKLARLLQTLFEQAGAKVYLTRNGDLTLTKDQRIQICNQMPNGGYYLRLNIDNSGKSAMLFKGGYYAGSEAGKNLLQSVADRLTAAEFTDKVQIAVSDEPEIRLTNRAAISVDLHLNPGDSRIISDEVYLKRIAQSVFLGFLKELGQSYLMTTGTLSLKITDHDKPVPGATISIDPLFSQTTNQDGEVSIEFIEPGEYFVTIEHQILYKAERVIRVRGQEQILIDLSK